MKIYFSDNKDEFGKVDKIFCLDILSCPFLDDFIQIGIDGSKQTLYEEKI